MIGPVIATVLDAPVLRVGALYGPMVLAAAAYQVRRREPKQFVGVLLALLWALPSLVVLQRLNQLAGWWSYAPSEAMLRGMPLELLLGWAVLWGVVPQLAFPHAPVWRTALLMGAFDLALMPRLAPAVALGSCWLAGEAVAIALVLVPALTMSRLTLEQRRVRLRAAVQIVTSGMIFLFLLPEIAFALRPGAGWSPLLRMSRQSLSLGLELVFLAAVPGLSAVLEFAERGAGTPIPYDPPLRLVTSGVYRYVANPMQLSCTLTMLLWAGMLRNGWLALASGVSLIYSAGLAAWDERADLEQRFGEDWRAYRLEVRDWWPRWRPYHAGANARIYIARGCGPCSEVRAWLEARQPIGLAICDAESLPPGTTRRILYDPGDGTALVNGVRAVGRALEHLNLGYGFAGAALRLPVIWQVVQGLLDVSGLGPRDVAVRCETFTLSQSQASAIPPGHRCDSRRRACLRAGRADLRRGG